MKTRPTAEPATTSPIPWYRSQFLQPNWYHMSRSTYHNRDHLVSNEATLRDIMTAPPTSAEAHAAQRQRQLQTRLRLEALREERELALDRGWH